LFPADPGDRAAVEQAEHWANYTLQMAARRVLAAWAVRDPAASARAFATGRMGHLLYGREWARRLIIPVIGRRVFATGPSADRRLLAEYTGMLDRIDSLIGDGVLGGAQLNAADFMVVPSLALTLYRPDVMHLFEGRPALELVDRLLPEPA
jgi:glutathione S-transferase